jgi:hypothetical protein
MTELLLLEKSKATHTFMVQGFLLVSLGMRMEINRWKLKSVNWRSSVIYVAWNFDAVFRASPPGQVSRVAIRVLATQTRKL